MRKTRIKNAAIILLISILLISVLLFLYLTSSLPTAHMKLLAVAEIENGYEGSVADLYLTIKPGSGRVFVETFPLMKLDTQISTRFAKEIACSEAEISCSNYDFFYTIKADSAIIGGPSASAAVSAITYAELKHLKIDEKKTVTGTINSGGIIGSVGGIKAKIEAAADAGIKTVFIPEGENIMVQINDTKNVSIQEYAKESGIEVLEISDLNEVIYGLTGKKLREFQGEIKIDPSYSKIMENISQELCARSQKLLKEVYERKEQLNRVDNNLTKIKGYFKDYENAKNLTLKAESEMKNANFYSAASYCYGANVKLRFLDKLAEKMNYSEMCSYADDIKKQLKDSYATSDKNYQTITGLQAYVIVNSRLEEAQKYYNDAIKEIASENMESAVYDLAYAEERIVSSELWKEFFKMPGKKFNFNEENMKELCLNKIAEAEERYQYAALFLKIPLSSASEKIEDAISDSKEKKYETCFDKASRAKAEAEIIMGVSEVELNQTKKILEKRLEITKQRILMQGSKGMFPIAGFSYYEYANSLKDSDIASAFIYSGYALELSNIDIYFQKTNLLFHFYKIYAGITMVFISGLAIGMLLAIYIKKKIEYEEYLKKEIVTKEILSEMRKKIASKKRKNKINKYIRKRK